MMFATVPQGLVIVLGVPWAASTHPRRARWIFYESLYPWWSRCGHVSGFRAQSRRHGSERLGIGPLSEWQDGSPLGRDGV